MTSTGNVESLLWDLERGFWAEGAEYYDRHLAPDAILVFPGMTLDRHGTIDTIAGAPRWTTAAFHDRRFLTIADDVVAIHYRVEAQREDQPSAYRALATSVYVRRGAGWRLAVHQQTP